MSKKKKEEIIVQITPPVKEIKKRKRKSKETAWYVSPKEFLEDLKEYYRTDVITDQLADKINKIIEGLGYAPNFINYCISSSSEALTNRGWRRYNEITLADQILAYDLETQKLVWSNIKNIFSQKYNGLMHHIKGNGIDALVTPGHKFVAVTDPERGICKLKPIEDLKGEEYLILNAPISKYSRYKYKQLNLTCHFPYNTKYLEFSKNINDLNFPGFQAKGWWFKKKNIPTEPYNGIVWCPQTEHETFICRNNGTIFITGNSYKEEMKGDARVKMVAALMHKKFDISKGSSCFGYYTTIAWHAFINRIKKEKKQHETIENYKEQSYSNLLNSGEGSDKNVYVNPDHHGLDNED